MQKSAQLQLSMAVQDIYLLMQVSHAQVLLQLQAQMHSSMGTFIPKVSVFHHAVALELLFKPLC